MNTKYIKTVFGRPVFILVILTIALWLTAGVATWRAVAQEANPHIEAFAWFDRYSLVDWPAGEEIEVTIENPDTEISPDYQITFTPDGSTNWYDFFPGVDLQPGFVIVAKNDETTKELVISSLSATVDDAQTGEVSGLATPGRSFHMRVDGDHFQLPVEQEIAAPDGSWSATIGSYLPWEWFTRGEMWEGDDDGDVTYAIWHVHNELIEVWLAQNEIRAFDWPLGAALTFNVNGNDIATGVAPQPVFWMEGTWAVVNAGDFGIQLEPGMEVSVSDGTTTEFTVIQDLKIISADSETDIAYGYAPLNADLELASWEDSPVLRFFNTGGNNNWSVDYRESSVNGVTVDLNPGDELRLFMREPDKDSTVWQSFVPHTRFTVFPEWEWFDGLEWPDGAVFISVEGKPECDLERESSGGFFNGNFPKGCDVAMGDTVTFTDGITTRMHEVRNLAVTRVDKDENTVAGTADEATVVYVWPHDAWFGPLQVTVGESQTWQVDLDDVGYDIHEGASGRSEIRDDVGNATAVDWQAPQPRIMAFPESDQVFGYDWPVGSEVSLSINGGYIKTVVVGPTPWNANDINAYFELRDLHNLEPYEVITLSGRGIERSYTVQNLAVTEVNENDNFVAGTAEVGAIVHAWVHEYGETEKVLTVADGAWVADFGASGFDLQEGMCGRAEIREEAAYGWTGATAVDWCIPKPRFTVFPEWEWFDGLDWPDGAMVTITVEGKPECYLERESQDYFFNGNFPEGCDVAIGDTVTFTDGTTIRTHEVRNLAVTEVDRSANTVKGNADAGAQLFVWAHEYGQYEVRPIANENGNWTADFAETGFDLQAGMCGRSEIRDEVGNATAVDWCVSVPYWRDEFNEALGEDWYWVNENDTRWSLTENPGSLRIYTSPYGTGGENLLLRPLAQGDFMIKTHLLFEPNTNFQFAGLVIWQDESNFLQFGRAFCDIEGPCVGNGIYFDRVIGGSGFDSPNFATPVDSLDEAYLRLERRGEMVKAFFSYDGTSWFEIGTHWIPSDFQVKGVGLTSSQDFSEVSVPADFDFFEVTEGQGFLPEGFHDYDQGDVPSWACNAGGWAADPDDRAARLNVNVFVDGGGVASLTASEFRQDLLDAGVCEGGNCGFFTEMRDKISSYDPHTVAAWAQDSATGEWVRLSNSPKPLTCRTYDIYAYDPLTGTTRQITDMRDADEYNPSWSPNGKLVAHHTVKLDGSSGIYITDIKTGLSKPLIGAENGGYAAWSPNGKWIVFSKDANIYLVPPAGSNTPKLVRKDADMPAWAPNGKRLVFRDTSDNSIRTIAVDGGRGGETIITAAGWNPEWSPDGSWIVFDLNGDVWKVQVNVLGKALGEPVQLTSLAAGEGHATWSADSQTIVYHAGLSRDYDLWSVPAAGGEPTWLTGAPEFGDYDPAYARNSSSVAYASFSPEGQATRTWVSPFTYDIPTGSWSEGAHFYQFWSGGSPEGEERWFDVSNDQPLYQGTVLLRPGGLVANIGWGWDCNRVGVISPAQQTQFHVGWTVGGTYSEALTYYENLMAQVAWDGGAPVGMLQHEIFPFTSQVNWWQYLCKSTAAPARILVQITENWFVAQRFATDTELTYWIYNNENREELLRSGTMWSNSNGTADAWVGDTLSLQPGNYLVISDGITTKEIVLEDLHFNQLNASTGHVEGTAPEPYGRPVWIGIGFPDAGWERWATTGEAGEWSAEFDQPVPLNYQWVAAQIFDADGDISEVRPEQIVGPTIMAGNFSVQWSATNPEEVDYLSWKGSGNLADACTPPDCTNAFEFFGNSWVSENENAPEFFFASLVGGGTTGASSQTGTTVDINSICLGCWNSADTPIHTTYQFFDDELRANLIVVQREFMFGDTPYQHNVRSFIPRLHPKTGFTDVLHPNSDGTELVTDATCPFGCQVTDWDGSWFAIHNPETGVGMIVQRAPSAYSTGLWVDDDDASFTNASSFLLLQPEGGFTGTVTETEYLCFYDSSTWMPSLTLPDGCQP